MRRLGMVLICATALVVTGCGGDDENGGDTDAATTAPTADLAPQPEPDVPISELLPEINEAFANGDCEQYLELAHWQTRATPNRDAPATDEECQAAAPLLRDFEQLEFTESEEFGTGAITQGAAPEGVKQAEDEVTALIWILDDGEWRHLQNLFIGDPQIGTEPAGDPLANAETFVDAAREGDCREMEPVLQPDGVLAQGAEGNLREACELITQGRVLAPALEQTPETELADFGGTLDNTFVGLPTEEEYFTIYLTTPTVEPGQEEQETEMLVSDARSNTVDPEEVFPEEQPAEE